MKLKYLCNPTGIESGCAANELALAFRQVDIFAGFWADLGKVSRFAALASTRGLLRGTVSHLLPLQPLGVVGVHPVEALIVGAELLRCSSSVVAGWYPSSVVAARSLARLGVFMP